MNDVCTGCGEPNPPGTQFCLFCGIYLGWDEHEADDGPATEPLVDAPTSSVPEPPGQGPAAAPGAPAAGPATGLAAPPMESTAAGSTAPVGMPVPAASLAHGCPACGRENDPGRRFCGHCGQVLAHGAPVRAPAPRRRRWWQRLLRSDTRIARRAYRHSLPALYRWRRVGLTALLVLLIGGGFAVVGRDPVGWGFDRWQDVTNRLEPVQAVTARAEPEASVIGDNDAAHLLDADPDSAWVTTWPPPEEPSACGAAPGGRVVLTFPPTRVRELHVITGVSDPSERLLQHVPAQLHLLLPDDTCRTVSLTRAAGLQTVPFDTTEPVSRLTISIGAAHRSDDERVEDVAGLSQLTLVARPSRGG